MGLKRVTKKFLRYLIPILLISLVIPVTETGRMALQAVNGPYEGKRLRCVIALGDYDQLSKGYLTGYNYEMLTRFADSLAGGAKVVLADPRRNYLDSLAQDSLDILVPGAARPRSPSGERVLGGIPGRLADGLAHQVRLPETEKAFRLDDFIRSHR